MQDSKVQNVPLNGEVHYTWLMLAGLPEEALETILAVLISTYNITDPTS
jgi:hypothetical protein